MEKGVGGVIAKEVADWFVEEHMARGHGTGGAKGSVARAGATTTLMRETEIDIVEERAQNWEGGMVFLKAPFDFVVSLGQSPDEGDIGDIEIFLGTKVVAYKSDTYGDGFGAIHKVSDEAGERGNIVFVHDYGDVEIIPIVAGKGFDGAHYIGKARLATAVAPSAIVY